VDGMHDLGGKQGFGPVRYSLKAAAFHAEWEKRANALVALAVKRGIFNMDEYRHAIERMDPRHYLFASYYERSLTGLMTLLVEKGVVQHEALEAVDDSRAGELPISFAPELLNELGVRRSQRIAAEATSPKLIVPKRSRAVIQASGAAGTTVRRIPCGILPP